MQEIDNNGALGNTSNKNLLGIWILIRLRIPVNNNNKFGNSEKALSCNYHEVYLVKRIEIVLAEIKVCWRCVGGSCLAQLPTIII